MTLGPACMCGSSPRPSVPPLGLTSQLIVLASGRPAEAPPEGPPVARWVGGRPRQSLQLHRCLLSRGKLPWVVSASPEGSEGLHNHIQHPLPHFGVPGSPTKALTSDQQRCLSRPAQHLWSCACFALRGLGLPVSPTETLRAGWLSPLPTPPPGDTGNPLGHNVA